MVKTTAGHAPALPRLEPDVRLYGAVDEDMLAAFLRQKAALDGNGPFVLELSTSGGNAEMGRRLAEELRLWQHAGTALYFFGKAYVYSAGTTVMAAVPAHQRFLSQDCELLVHERKLCKQLTLEGSLRSSRAKIADLLAEIDAGQRLEREGFARLACGSRLTLEQLEERVCKHDWYLNAHEAVELGLVAGTV